MNAQQFYNYIQLHAIEQRVGSLDFIKDFEGDKTLNEWVEYTITTLQELNGDLDSTNDEETIERNDETCRALLCFRDDTNRPFRVCSHCLQALISREPVKYVRVDSIYEPYMLCDWCSEFGHDELFEII